MLDVLKEGYSKGFNQVTPSMGIWTSDGKAFMETLVRDGYIDKSYKVLDKIKKYKTKNALTDIWKQAQKPNSEAGKLLKSPLIVGAGATAVGAYTAKKIYTVKDLDN